MQDAQILNIATQYNCTSRLYRLDCTPRGSPVRSPKNLAQFILHRIQTHTKIAQTRIKTIKSDNLEQRKLHIMDNLSDEIASVMSDVIDEVSGAAETDDEREQIRID